MLPTPELVMRKTSLAARKGKKNFMRALLPVTALPAAVVLTVPWVTTAPATLIAPRATLVVPSRLVPAKV
jgi:hypothetical protein